MRQKTGNHPIGKMHRARYSTVALPMAASLQQMIARYERTLQEFAAIEEELRLLPPSPALAEAIRHNTEARTALNRALAIAKGRLADQHQTRATAAG